VVGWVDLFTPEADASLARLSADGLFRGVRLAAQSEADDYLARHDVASGVGRLTPFDLTFDMLIRERQLPAAVALADRLPAQRFVLDHLAKPRVRDGVLEPWATQLRELARRTNVWCKVSGLITEADWSAWRPVDLRPYLDVAFEAFGVERLMFGSDWPVCLVAGDYPRVFGVVADYANALSTNERQALFGGNAARFYGLEDRGGRREPRT
jgi:L-fucono-1,5-lactonase